MKQTLSRRQQELLGLLAEGITLVDVAKKLHIGESTVKSTARDLYTRLGARTAAHAVAIGYERGLLP